MYRLRNTERKVNIVFDTHPISGVFFVCLKYLFGKRTALCTRRGAFCFSWKALEYESNGKNNRPKGVFFMMTAIRTLLKIERGDAHEEIKKQNIIYGA